MESFNFNSQSPGGMQVFRSPEFGDIRTFGSSVNPLFCASDVCKALGYSNGRDAISKHCELEDVAKCDTPTLSGVQAMTYITEAGLYGLIFGSNLPKAKEFKRWVTAEVLPAIRKNGGYLQSFQNETPEQLMARAIKVAEATLSRTQERLAFETKRAEMEAQRAQIAEQEIQQLKPAADYTKDVLMSASDYTLTQIGKDLGFCSVFAFTRWAKNRGILYKQSGQWLSTARYAGRGFFRKRTCRFFHNDGTPGSSLSLVVTEAGRMKLHELLNKERNAAQKEL